MSFDPHDETNEEKRGFSEMMRDFALSGMATFFMTEDAVRSYLKEMKLPKELASLLLDGVSRKKDEFYSTMVKEFGKVLSKVDVSREFAKFLETHRINVEAKISFEPKDSSRGSTPPAEQESEPKKG